LGNEYIVTKRTSFLGLDLGEYKRLRSGIEQYQQKVRVKFREPLVVHPNHFMLASSLEYISLPHDLMGYLIGRSSLGRLGLVIATASLVDPTFTGTVTFEMVNLGELPIVLYPGIRIAQIVLHSLSSPTDKRYSGKYGVSTGPQFSRIYSDRDLPSIVPKVDLERIAVEAILADIESKVSEQVKAKDMGEGMKHEVEKRLTDLKNSLISKLLNSGQVP
jgi:dCTP deaminase